MRMDLEKKLKSLPKELLPEVEQYIDFLLYKVEKSKVEAELKREKKAAIKAETTSEQPITESAPPPVKEHKVLGLFNTTGPSNTVSSILSNISSTPKSTNPPTNPQSSNGNVLSNSDKTGWDAPISPKNSSASTPPKTEMLGEREIETERKLYPCPHCEKIVQDNWEICPYCEKSLRESTTPAKKPKK